MKKNLLLLVSFFSFLTICNNANAQLFNVTATRQSNGQTVSGSFDSAEEALEYFQGENLNRAFGDDVDGEAVTISLNYRGLGSSLAFDGGNNLTLNIPGIVDNMVFSGSSRDAAVESLKDFFKSNGGDLLNQINKRLAAVSPVDPVAGNPTSLMSQMVDDDFELAFVDSLHDSEEPDSQGKRVGDEMGAGVKYSNYSVSGIDSQVISVAPFSWRKNFGESRAKLLVKVPVLKMIMTENAKTYQASGAVGFSFPIYKQYWAIAPIISYGVVGSEDLATGAAMRGISATNKLRFDAGGWGFHLGTLYGVYENQKLKVQDYESNPGIKNNILKNSVVVSMPVGTMARYAIDFSATNTRFYGSELYIENAMDYGIGFVKTNKTHNNEARLDLKYYTYDAETTASIGNNKRGVKGFSANLKFQY